jgi:hypothetical protein
MTRPLLAVVLLALCACEPTVVASSGRADCNGLLDAREATVDDLFDTDGDGYFDAGNPACVETYAPEELDCNDSNPDMNPGLDEVVCDGLDNDCDEATEDEIDADEDGYSTCEADCNDGEPLVNPGLGEVACDELDNDCNPGTVDSTDSDSDGWSNCDDCVDSNPEINPGLSEEECNGLDDDCDPASLDGTDFDFDGSTDCFDCDDLDPERFPGNPEICEDGIDQNCDEVDADCVQQTFSGTWTTNAVTYSCGGGNVDINFSAITVDDNTPTMNFIFVGGLHPGVMSGSIDGSGNFSATSSSGGACSRSFNLSGAFVGPDTFNATFSANLSACTGCQDQSWNLNGSR